MRVNIYGEELTDRIERVTKEVTEEATGEVFTFYGVRFWLKFPNQDWWIHRKVDGEEDDLVQPAAEEHLVRRVIDAQLRGGPICREDEVAF